MAAEYPKRTCDMCNEPNRFTITLDSELHCIECVHKYQTVNDALGRLIVAELVAMKAAAAIEEDDDDGSIDSER